MTSLHQENAVEATVTATRVAVLYHYPCEVGAFAAVVAHLYFSHLSPTAPPPLFFPYEDLSPVRVEDLPLNEIDTVYFLDFSGPQVFIDQLLPKVQSIIIIDDQETARERLPSATADSGNLIEVMDTKRNAAAIAYDYFEEKLLGSKDNCSNDIKKKGLDEFKRMRRTFKYIADIRNGYLPNSKAFFSGFKDLKLEYNVRLNPALFQQLLSINLESIIAKGFVRLAHEQKVIDKLLLKSYEIALGGGKFGHCLAVYVRNELDDLDELGYQLACKSRKMNLRGIGAVAYRLEGLADNKLEISLFSVGEDTTFVWQEYRGEGCKHAGSFPLPVSEYKTWNVSRKPVDSIPSMNFQDVFKDCRGTDNVKSTRKALTGKAQYLNGQPTPPTSVQSAASGQSVPPSPQAGKGKELATSVKKRKDTSSPRNGSERAKGRALPESGGPTRPLSGPSASALTAAPQLLGGPSASVLSAASQPPGGPALALTVAPQPLGCPYASTLTAVSQPWGGPPGSILTAASQSWGGPPASALTAAPRPVPPTLTPSSVSWPWGGPHASTPTAVSGKWRGPTASTLTATSQASYGSPASTPSGSPQASCGPPASGLTTSQPSGGPTASALTAASQPLGGIPASTLTNVSTAVCGSDDPELGRTLLYNCLTPAERRHDANRDLNEINRLMNIYLMQLISLNMEADNQLGDVYNKVKELEKMGQMSREELETLRREKETLMKENMALKEEKESWTCGLHDSQTKIKSLETDKGHLIQYNNNLKAQNNSFMSQLNQLMAQNNSFMNQLAMAKKTGAFEYRMSEEFKKEMKDYAEGAAVGGFRNALSQVARLGFDWRGRVEMKNTKCLRSIFNEFRASDNEVLDPEWIEEDVDVGASGAAMEAEGGDALPTGHH